MMSPTFDEEGKNKNTGKIIPVYPLTYNLSRKYHKTNYRKWVKDDKRIFKRNITRVFIRGISSIIL